jgi:hypothetical protein
VLWLSWSLNWPARLCFGRQQKIREEELSSKSTGSLQATLSALASLSLSRKGFSFVTDTAMRRKEKKKDGKPLEFEEKMRLSGQSHNEHAKSGKTKLSKGYVKRPPAVVVCSCSLNFQVL